MKRSIIAAMICMVVTACGFKDTVTNYFSRGDDNADPPAPLVSFQTKINVIRLWEEKAGSGTEEEYLKLSPIVAAQRLFIADRDGRLLALDATNGNRLWSIDVDAHVTGGPGYGQNTVLLGTAEGQVIAVTADSGKERWRSRVSSEILSPPLMSANTVVVRTIDGKIFGLSGDSGKRLWIYDRSVPALTLRGTGTPVIDNGIVIAGFDGGRLAALELVTGRLLWEVRVTTARGRSELERMVDIDSQPLVIEGVVYVVTFQGHLAAVQQQTGRIVWSREISSYAGLSGDETNIYAATADSQVWSFDRFTGTTNWKQEKLEARAITAPASIGDYVVVGDLEGYLHWMDKFDGKFVARVRHSKDRIIATPLVVGHVLYQYGSEGKLGAYTFR